MFPINKFSIKTVSENETEGVFHVGPLPKGYGNTLGTTYRRLLLSSIPGAAITSIVLDGVQHEYTALAGLEDDILAVVLALKGIAVKSLSDEPVKVKISAKGQKSGPTDVTAADIEANPMIEVINPEHVITTLADASAKFEAELTIERGLGYAYPDEEVRKEVGAIPVDPIFTPVRQVSVNVSNTRVGQQTDLDLLELKVITDGTLAPSAALFQAADILVKVSTHLYESAEDLLNAKDKDQIDTSLIPMEDPEVVEEEVVEPIMIEDLDISTRLRNALINNNYADLRALDGLTEEEIRNVKGMGEKSFDELLGVLEKYDLRLI